jgi:hypothetical protein
MSHTGTLRVDAPPEHAFQLFTAPGECFWIDDWDPDILSGDGREKGTVWITNVAGATAYWIVVDYDADALHARYARIAPDTRAGTVEVFARDDGTGATEVEVTYELTALTDEGGKQLATFDAEAYSRMLADWERMIREANLEYPLPFVTARAPVGAVSSDR